MNELLRRILFLPPQASTFASDIDHLHYFVILTTMAGAFAVTLAGGYLLVRYRRESEHEVDPPRQERAPTPPLWAEAVVVVGLFSLFLLMWLIGFRQFTTLRVAPPDSMIVYVTAKQWMWKFAYPDGGRSIAALYVPAGKPVKLVMSSRDVIHSFYVPDFRIKEDAVPGRYTTVWFEAKEPGTHDIFCAEYCGANHSTMRGEVVVLDPADFARWQRGLVAAQPIAGQRYEEPATVEDFPVEQPLDLTALGRSVAANQGCLRCHSLDGSPHIGPTWAGLYGSLVPLQDGKSLVADEAYLTESMMDPRAKVHSGFAPVMPSYLGLITPYETSALVELIRSLRDVPPQTAPHPSPDTDLSLDLTPPAAPAAAPPAQQGLPPPGSVAMPPPQGRESGPTLPPPVPPSSDGRKP